jgi:hypothetical protein
LVTIPFTAAKDKAHIEIGLGSGVTADLTGKTLTARIRLDSGLTTDTDNPAGANVFAKSGTDYAYGGGEWTDLKGTGWITLTMNVTTPAGYVGTGYDPTKIVAIGVQIATGDTATALSTATLHIDSVSYQ